MLTYYIKLYLSTLAVFFVIDLFWLGLVARNLYQKYLGFLLNPNTNWIAAILFYLFWVAGLLVFAVAPGLQADSLRKALLLGALFGFLTYATYDLTNLATIKNWPLTVTLVDLLWGTTLATLVSYLSFLIGRRLG